MNNFLRIGQVCELYGISLDTLRYYDKKKILVPIVDKENGYRYYTMEHLDVLEMILIGRYLEIPLEQLKEKIEVESIDGYLEMMELQNKVIQERRKELEKLSRYTKEMVNILKTISNFNNDWTFSKGIKEKELDISIYSIEVKHLFSKTEHNFSSRIEEFQQWMTYDIKSDNSLGNKVIGLSVVEGIENEKEIEEYFDKLVKSEFAFKHHLQGKWNYIGFWGNEENLVKYINELYNCKNLKNNTVYIKFKFAMLHKDMKHEYFTEIYFRQ